MGFLDDLKKKALDVASRAYDQVNAYDNGRTWKQRTPTNNQSTFQQGMNSWSSRNIARPAGRVAQRSANTVAAGTTGLIGAGWAGKESLFGTDESYQHALNMTSDAMDYSLDKGWGGKGSYLTSKQASSSGDGWQGMKDNFIKPTLKATADIAPYVVPAGGVGQAGSLVARVGTQAAVNAGVSGATNAASQWADKGHVDGKELGMNTLLGGLIGGVVPLAGAGLKGAANKMIPLNEAGALHLGGGLEPRGDPDVTRRMVLDYFRRPNPNAPTSTLGGASAVEVLPEMAASKKQALIDGLKNGAEKVKGQGPVTAPPVSIPPAGKAPLPAAPVGPPNTKLSRFANKTVQNSDEVSPGLQKMVKDEQVSYVPTTNEARLAEADKWLKGKSGNRAYEEAVKSFENPGAVTDQHVVNAIALAKKLDATGKESDLFKATEIYDNLSSHLTKKGQEIQAASVLNQRTPQGLQYSALKALKKAGHPASEETQKTIQGMVEKIKGLDPGSELHDRAVKELQQFVGRQIPSSFTDKAISTWKAGLLTGVKTITGNGLSNGSFRLLHELSKPGAAIIDNVLSIGTGKRSQALTYRGSAGGAIEGAGKGWKFLKTGIDERAGVGNKFLENGGQEINFKNKVIGKYVNGVFRNMAAQDRPFYYSQLRTSMHELANVEGLNQGLGGKQLRTFVKNKLADPDLKLMQAAKNEADKAVLAEHTALSAIASGARRGIDSMEPSVGKTALKVGLETTAPFTGVPSAFVSRVIDFTPVGALKEIGNQLMHKKFDQRALTTALSEATTGTALMWLGSKLADAKLLSGAYPNNPQEQARWKAEGISPNSVKVGDKWLSLNYLGPAGMLFNAGGRASEAKKDGAGTAGQIAQAAGGAPKDLTQQSFLQGISTAANAVNEPGRYLNNYMNSQAGSIVPTIVNDTGNATDNKQRDKDNVGAAVMARLPVARNSLPQSSDVFGNPLNATSNPLDRMANPLRPSTERKSDLFSEINRLKLKADLDTTPAPIKNKQTFDGTDVALNDDQRRELQKNVGSNVQNLWNQAIKSPEYQGLSDDGKKNMLENIYSKVYEGEKSRYAQKKTLGQYSPDFKGDAKRVSKDAKNYLEGDLSISKFAKEKDADGNYTTDSSEYYKSNDAEYKDMVSKYEDDVKSGNLSKVGQIKAKDALAKAKVGAKYSKDTRDMYGLSKDDLWSLVSTDKNGKKYAEDVVAYGDDLVAAGLLDYNKFRTKKGDIALKPKEKGSGGGKGKGRGKGGKAAKGESLASTIALTGKLSSAARGAKVGKANFSSKVQARGIQAYKKSSSKKVSVQKKQLVRSNA